MYDLNNSMIDHFSRLYEEENWEELEKVDVGDYCALCMIKRKQKSFHCKSTNLCIPGYHRHMGLTAAPIYFANQHIYLLYLLASFLSPACLLVYLSSIIEIQSTVGWYLHWFELLHTVSEESSRLVAFVLFLIGYFSLYRLYHLLVFLYCVSAGLTLHEVYRPHHHKYLFIQSEKVRSKFSFKNPNSRGLIMNWCTFIRQIFNQKHI